MYIFYLWGYILRIILCVLANVVFSFNYEVLGLSLTILVVAGFHFLYKTDKTADYQAFIANLLVFFYIYALYIVAFFFYGELSACFSEVIIQQNSEYFQLRLVVVKILVRIAFLLTFYILISGYWVVKVYSLSFLNRFVIGTIFCLFFSFLTLCGIEMYYQYSVLLLVKLDALSTTIVDSPIQNPKTEGPTIKAYSLESGDGADKKDSDDQSQKKSSRFKIEVTPDLIITVVIIIAILIF